MRRYYQLWSVLVFLATLGACNASTRGVCEPGETQNCLCIGAGQGVQVCSSEGTTWEPCKGCPDEWAPDLLGDASTAEEKEPDAIVEDTGPDDDKDEATPSPDICSTDCDSLGWECGVVCGEDCGNCPAGVMCANGHCGCEPDCEGKECGDDGCGGKCGYCGNQSQCEDDKCSCSPKCWKVECGDDGCGGSCGSCPAGAKCENAKCVCHLWTDPTSGLMWENPPQGGAKEWSSAKSFCEELALDGYKDWRLPTIGELRTLIRGCPDTEPEGNCQVGDNCLEHQCSLEFCSGCTWMGGPGPEGMYWPDELVLLGAGNHWHWSSSPMGPAGEGYSSVWVAIFAAASLVAESPLVKLPFRCVR